MTEVPIDVADSDTRFARNGAKRGILKAFSHKLVSSSKKDTFFGFGIHGVLFSVTERAAKFSNVNNVHNTQS